MDKLSSVVIVGRMNVGKSTLFNKLSSQEKSIAYDYAGVTRDFVTDAVSWQGKRFLLVDTGGISLKKSQDTMQEAVRQRAIHALQEAAVVLFMCDGQTGPLAEDQDIARYLHKMGKKVLLVVNKIDSTDAVSLEYAFRSLGFAHSVAISAEHSRGIAELLEQVVNLLPDQGAKVIEEETKASVVILGKPNVGKSSLMNVLLKDERMIVSDVAGTTREAIKEKIRFYQETIELVDTPGVRKKRSVDEPLEQLMVKSSLRAVKHADIVLLMLDGTVGEISDQELKLAFYVFEQGKGLIILYNKSDKMEESHKDAFARQAPLYRQLLTKVPHLTISCVSKKNVGKIMPLVDEVFKRYTQQFNDQALTMLFKEWLQKTPLYHTTQPLTVYKVKQIATRPPSLLVFVNKADWFGASQRAFFENRLRTEYDLLGVPVLFTFRSGE